MDRDAIVWREWDGEFVVRNERTGSTHLLGPLAGRVLQVLLESDSAFTSAEIISGLRDQAALDVVDTGAEIESVLSEFQRLGLTEPEPR
jgi:PqqD family protein of HPr-rel-A system